MFTITKSSSLIIVFLSIAFLSKGQSVQQQQDSLKREILALKSDVESIKFNLAKSESQLRKGMLVSIIGYSTVIAGGLILGREEQTGKALLVAGGVTGVIGTAILLDGFRYIGRPHRANRK